MPRDLQENATTISVAARVLDELRGFKQGRWVNEVADAVGASERTVRRDLTELQDAGMDIEVTKRANRVFAVLAAERSYSPVAITKRERFTLLAVRRVFDVFRRTPFLDDVLSVLQKLEQRMNDKERAELAAFGEQFVYMPDHGTKSHEGTRRVSTQTLRDHSTAAQPTLPNPACLSSDHTDPIVTRSRGISVWVPTSVVPCQGSRGHRWSSAVATLEKLRSFLHTLPMTSVAFAAETERRAGTHSFAEIAACGSRLRHVVPSHRRAVVQSSLHAQAIREGNVQRGLILKK
jgi:hypothetical protein